MECPLCSLGGSYRVAAIRPGSLADLSLCSEHAKQRGEFTRAFEEGRYYDTRDLIREIETGEPALTVAEKNVGFGI